MGCPAKHAKQMTPTVSTNAVGQSPLVVIHYVGLIDSDTYEGLATGQIYQFGLLGRHMGFVDRRDVPGLLTIEEDGKPVFEVLG